MAQKAASPAKQPTVMTPWVGTVATGMELLKRPLLNKSVAFTMEERDRYRIRGLIPAVVQNQDVQLKRALWNLRKITDPLQKYLYLAGLQDRNEKLYYRLLVENIAECMPIVYTPVVGQACQEFGHIYRHPRGLYISIEDLGHVREILDNWPQRPVKAIVVTDGERILGLGDQGADGMGIPIGKLALYSAIGGLAPEACLPITLDVGTDRKEKLEDPMYIGLHRQRERGPKYDQLIEEFMTGVQQVYGENTLIQFEDFGNTNAFRVLDKYKERCCCFNDDIQGTASVAVGGIYAACKMTGHSLKDHTFLFLGAGEAGAGIGMLIAEAIAEDFHVPLEEALKHIYLFDSKGLVVKSCKDLAHHKIPFAHDKPFVKDFIDAIKEIKPTGIIGVSAQPNAFTEEIVREMGKINKHPIVFALSNPTSKAECSAENAYKWTEGRAIFASGSPFPDYEMNGKKFVPGQGNNAYIFPGIGLAVVATGCRRVTEHMFLTAAKALADQCVQTDFDVGSCYPPLRNIREVSIKISVAVAEEIFHAGLATIAKPADMNALIRSHIFSTDYASFMQIVGVLSQP